MRRSIVLLVTVLVAVLMHASWADVGLSYPRKPKSHSKPKPHKCVQKFNAKDDSLVFLLNRCEELMYVSVVEYADQMPQRTCAVFGLQAKGYGKAYAPGEQFSEDTLKVSRSASTVMRECGMSSYETVGGGLGMFVRIVDERAHEKRLAQQLAQREEARRKSEDAVVMYICDDCDQQLVTLMNGLELTTSQSRDFVPIMKQTVAKIESMIKRRRLKQGHRDLEFVIRNSKRHIWESAEQTFKGILRTEQWGAYEVLRSYVDRQTGSVEGGFGADDYVFDRGTNGADASSLGLNGLQ